MSLAEALQPALAAASTISDTSSQPGQSVAELGDAGNKEDTDKADDGTATTLTLRNLPPSFDQQTTREWVDSKGYKGAYDFLLWFPAKKTSRLNTSSYAFVNFCGPDLAKRFRQENHLLRFSSEGGDELDKKQQWPLSIAVAKVQGFAENYLRFHHLTDDNSPTLCQPYFASDSLGLLPQETRDAAAATPTQAPKPVDTLPDFGSVITLILRNLPLSMNTQDRARQWLDKSGFEGQYDFFLYLPAKRRRPEQIAQGGPPQGLGYAFVNFQACEHAKRCAETLNGRAFTEGDPALNVVPARIQGLEECMRHFKSLAGSGRVAPWIEAAALRQCSARQFQ